MLTQTRTQTRTVTYANTNMDKNTNTIKKSTNSTKANKRTKVKTNTNNSKNASTNTKDRYDPYRYENLHRYTRSVPNPLANTRYLCFSQNTEDKEQNEHHHPMSLEATPKSPSQNVSQNKSQQEKGGDDVKDFKVYMRKNAQVDHA